MRLKGCRRKKRRAGQISAVREELVTLPSKEIGNYTHHVGRVPQANLVQAKKLGTRLPRARALILVTIDRGREVEKLGRGGDATQERLGK